MTAKLCPRTLRWCAGKLDRSAIQAISEPTGRVEARWSDVFTKEARAVEAKAKRSKKR